MIGILILTLTAFFLSVIIVLIDSKVRMTKKDRISELLPGYNCGVCGFGSCEGMAEAILLKKDNYLKCNILKEEEKLEINKILKNQKKKKK